MDKIINNNSINLSEALAALHGRRQPITKVPSYEKLGSDYDPIFESVTSSVSNEGTRYILGAMQPIPVWSTNYLYQQGEGFSKNIITSINLPLTFHFQGSVPLNVHIKSSSDLDILFIHSEKLYVPKVVSQYKYQYTDIDSRDVILFIKNKCIELFNQRLYDYEHNDKSVKVLKCLAVSADIVPACWYHTQEYQLSGREEEKGVAILKEKERKILPNYPFKHIYLVKNKNIFYHDKIGKCIRLLKNIKADLPNSDVITLSSFDITSFIYYMPEYIPNVIKINDDLALANCMHNYIQYILNNKNIFSSLFVPDKSRYIFDSPHKFTSLQTLDKNLSEILRIANHPVLY